MRILITGSRDWTDWQTIANAIESETTSDVDRSSVTIVHGGAVGADSLAGRIGDRLGMEVEVHPADWDTWGRRAGYIRNAHMVKEGADVCLAFIKDESKGATMTAELAQKSNIPTKIFRE